MQGVKFGKWCLFAGCLIVVVFVLGCFFQGKGGRLRPTKG